MRRLGDRKQPNWWAKITPYAFFIFLFYLVKYVTAFHQTNNFFIAFLDVGQGDAFVINIPQYGMILVDTGANYQSDYLSAKFSPSPTCNIRAVFITHYDMDHSGGLARLTRHCTDLQVIDQLSAGDSITFPGGSISALNVKRASEALRPKGRSFLSRKIPSISVINDGALLENKSEASKNDQSLILLLEYRSFRALLTGDAGAGVLLEALAKKKLGKIDVYKVPHHGSIHNHDVRIINLIKPSYCIISVGRNSYGHPSNTVIADLRSSNCQVFRTDLDGTVTLMLY